MQIKLVPVEKAHLDGHASLLLITMNSSQQPQSVQERLHSNGQRATCAVQSQWAVSKATLTGPVVPQRRVARGARKRQAIEPSFLPHRCIW